MADAYEELIDATLAHLRSLKARGTAFVRVDLAALNALKARGPSRLPSFRRAGDRETRTDVRTGAAAPDAPKVRPPAAVPPPAPVVQEPAVIQPTEAIASQRPSAEAKLAAMTDLRQRALACVKCANLAAARKSVVFGVGDINAELMFVGEAPGADEDEQGEPFVGKAGQLLTRIIQTMGFSRQTVYIANVLKCRPDTPDQAYGNRKPTPDEMKTCLPYLLAQIDLIKPKVIVALGGTAMEGLFARQTFITKVRGHWQTFRDIPVMPTYHPSYLLRNAGLRTKRELWEDMLQVLEKLGQPITEKQRNYFKSAAPPEPE